MDFCYDWLLAQIRHDLNKFLLILISQFACFGRNKINLKWQIKLNFIVDTWRSIRPPPYTPVKNVPALVSHEFNEENRRTNKPKAMEDDDATLSTDDFALFDRTTNDPPLSVPKQLFISSYNEATRENIKMDQQAMMQHNLRTTKHNRTTIQHRRS